MALFGGNKEKVEKDIKSEVEKYLIEGEEVEEVYGIKDHFNCLTNKRLIFVTQIPILKSLGVVSIPYSKINSATIQRENKGIITTTKLIISTRDREYELRFIDVESMMNFYKKLIKYITE
jgi:hypothetical protein